MKTLNEMKYEVIGIEMDLNEVVDFIIEHGEFETLFIQQLDETIVELCGMTFYGSDIMKSDRVAYKTSLSDFAESMREELEETVKQILLHDTDEICDIEVTCLGNETESEGK